MAFAPHHNGEVTPESDLPRILGSFVEKGRGNLFEYAGAREGLSPWSDYPHLVYVSHSSVGGLYRYRHAKVLKTVAYVVVDEDAFGEPVVEKWQIKQHREYAV